MSQLPYEILEAMIQCFGKSFHFKDRMAAFLANCEVPKTFIDKYRQEHKFVWARKLLTELGESEHHQMLHRKILTALCQLRNLPDSKVEDRDAGLLALIKPTHDACIVLRNPAAHRWATGRTTPIQASGFMASQSARSVFGLARSSARMGDLNSARHMYATFLEIWHQADPDLPELQEGKPVLQNTVQQ